MCRESTKTYTPDKVSVEKTDKRYEKNNFMIFEKNEFGKIRMVDIDGRIYFVGRDIANILGYSNPRDAISRHCKGVVKHDSFKEGGQEIALITEGDMYRLITHSKMENAINFEIWVFDEVLPSIRKNGGYISGQETMSDDELLAKAFVVAQNKIAERDKAISQLKTEVDVKNQLIGELKPKADYTDLILNNKGLVTITQIAKDYGMSGQEMNELLHGLGVQYKQSGQWLLYKDYHDKGYTHSVTVNFTRSDGRPDIKMNTKWTQKGRLFMYNLLKDNGYLPIIEQESA